MLYRSTKSLSCSNEQVFFIRKRAPAFVLTSNSSGTTGDGCWVPDNLCSTSLPLVTKNEAWPRWQSRERRPTRGCHDIWLAITIHLRPAREVWLQQREQ